MVHAIAYSPDGGYLASASNDRQVKVWDTSTGNERDSLAGHRGTALTAHGRKAIRFRRK